MRIRIAVVLLIFCCTKIVAQQEAQHTQFMVNPFLYNPALSGSEDYLDIKTGYRNQWTGIEGAPKTFYVSGHSPISKHHAQHSRIDDNFTRHSIGGLIGSDKAGDISFNTAYLSYSYTKTLAKGFDWGLKNHKRGIEIALGTSFGAKQYRLDLERIQAATDVESILLNNNKIVPDASLGAWLYMGDHIFAGLSAQQLFRNYLIKGQEARLFQHYNLVAGTEFKVARALKVLPAMMLKKVSGAPFSLDLNARIDYEETYFGGFSVRFGDAFSVMLGALVKDRYEIAYAYDYNTSKLGSYNSGTHEVILGFRLLPKYDVRNAEDNW